MKLNNLTKLTSANILAILGYMFAFSYLFLGFVYIPLDFANEALYADDPEMTGFVSSAVAAICVVLAFYILVTFFFFILFEFFIRKKNKTEFQLINKISKRYELGYKFLFWFGLFNMTPASWLIVFGILVLSYKYTNYADWLSGLVF